MAEPSQSVEKDDVDLPPEQENEPKNVTTVSPMIEIPTRSHGRLSTIMVTFDEFCKILVQYFETPETDDIVHCASLNDQFCLQIDEGGKGADGGGVQLRTRSSRKLPMQVAYDSEGNVRTNFPFDSQMLLSDLKQLNETTMTAIAVHRKKKLLVDYEQEESSQATVGDDSSASYVFGVKVDVSGEGHVTLVEEGDQHITDHDGSAELFSQNSQNSDGCFVLDTDVSDTQQVDLDGV